MALAANALTTVAELKTELSISGSAEDTKLERIINALSDAAESYCNRSFYNETAKVEKVEGFGGNLIVLSKRPLVSIASITFDGQTVDATSYEIHDAGAGLVYRPGGWTWTAEAILSITSPPAPSSERKLYTVTYNGGYVTPAQGGTRTLPYDLEDAVIMWAAARYLGVGRDRAIKSESLMSASVTYAGAGNPDSDESIPAEVRSVLDRYARVATA